MSTAHVLAAWLERPDLHPSVFLDTLSLSRKDKDTMWPIYTKLRGKCQIVGDVKVKVADDGSLWWPKAKAVDASESLWSGDTKTENVGEGTEVKDPLVTPDIEKKSPRRQTSTMSCRDWTKMKRRGPRQLIWKKSIEKTAVAFGIQGNQNGRQVWVGRPIKKGL